MKKILIANVGSTSYKYTVFEISENGDCRELFRGGVERVSDYETAIAQSLSDLESRGFGRESLDAVAFKTVLGKDVSGLRDADEVVLKALEDMSYVAPAHNPPYASAIRAFGKVLPSARKVVLFEPHCNSAILKTFFQILFDGNTAYLFRQIGRAHV